MPSGRSRYRKWVSDASPNGSSAKCTPGGRYSDGRGKFGRLRAGAAPIAVITFETSARCSISSTAIPVSSLCHRPTASACSGVSPSSAPVLRLKLAYRYWHMIRCSICAAWISRFHRCSRCSTTSLLSGINAPAGSAKTAQPK
jgi:hypothetical protein